MKQRFFAALAAVLTCSALFAAAPEKKQVQKPVAFTQYQDWQFVPVRIDDKKAGENVRNQMDFTVPVYGPWLTNPAPDSMTVTWITRIPCAGGIEYRETGTETWTRLWPVTYGQIDYSKDLHSFHLTGLKPAA